MTSAPFSTSIEAQQAAVLLQNYRFEMGHHDARQWVSLWLEFYRPSWIRDAVVEALYQGRYKSVSVRQILELWHRRGQPIRHVTYEFEAAICREFGELRLAPAKSAIASPHTQALPISENGRSANTVSFDLSDSATVPGMQPPAAASSEQLLAANSPETVGSSEPSEAAPEADALLQPRRRVRGILYASARAIQPFKPTLPFSGQTLRLVRQKILV